jgi:hypothetical protein
MGDGCCHRGNLKKLDSAQTHGEHDRAPHFSREAGLFAGVVRLRWSVLRFLRGLQAICGPICLSRHMAALQQRRTMRTLGYPRLHSMLARSLLLGG